MDADSTHLVGPNRREIDRDPTTPTTNEPDAAMRAMDRLVGTWRISGDAAGTVTYRWSSGRFILVQDGELDLFGHHICSIEIIGRARPFVGEPGSDIKSAAAGLIWGLASGDDGGVPPQRLDRGLHPCPVGAMVQHRDPADVSVVDSGTRQQHPLLGVHAT